MSNRLASDEHARYGAHRLFRDAVSLASSSLVNAAFGMASWALTARLIAPDKLGVMAAVLAIMATVSLAVSATIGDAFAALLPAAKSQRREIFRRGHIVFILASLAGGVGGGIIAITTIDTVHGSVPVFMLVVIGTVLYGMYMLQSATLTALGRAAWVVWTSTSMNILKIALLFGISITIEWHSLELSTVISAGLVALVMVPPIGRMIQPATRSHEELVDNRPSVGIADFNRFVPRAFVGILLGYAIFSLAPFLVTISSEPKQGALFALSLPLAQTLDLISAAMCSSLVVHAAADPSGAVSMARSVALRAALVVFGGGVAIVAFAPILLSYLNPTYRSMNAFTVIAVLCAASALRTPFAAWSALQRSRRHLRPMLVVAAVGAGTAIASIATLSPSLGALGGAIGLALAYIAMSMGAVIHILFMSEFTFGRRSR